MTRDMRPIIPWIAAVTLLHLWGCLRFSFVLALVALTLGGVACTKRDPTYCDDTYSCPPGQRCGPNKTCYPADAGPDGDTASLLPDFTVDGGKPPKPDAGVDGPVSVVSDGPPDVPVAPDGPIPDQPFLVDKMGMDIPIVPDSPVTLDCDGIRTCFMTCAKSCVGNTTCIAACHPVCSLSGCASAKNKWASFYGCFTSSCTADCIPDPSATGCDTCIQFNCGIESAACTADSC